MFTGIIESTARILERTDSGLTVERPDIFDDLKIGCSIAVSGVCLSVVAFDKTSMTFDVVPTTFSKTKLGFLNVGDLVNLERAMRADGRFEGHIVTGHVEGVGEVQETEQGGAGPMLKVHIPLHLVPYVVHHGSITIEGVALTVAELHENEVTVALIPHTIVSTTLGSVKIGDTLNIETDVLAKYILKAHEQS